MSTQINDLEKNRQQKLFNNDISGETNFVLWMMDN